MPPSSLYRASSRKVCRQASPITAAPDSTVRLPASISVNTSMRFRSRSLIWTSPIPLVSFLMGGNLSFLMGAYMMGVHNLHYQTYFWELVEIGSSVLACLRLSAVIVGL